MIQHQSANSIGNYNYNIYTYENGEWAPHFHKNFELIYVISGSLLLTVDNLSEKIPEGGFALILPNQVHSFSSYENNKIWVGVFSEDFIKEFAKTTKNRRSTQLLFHCKDNELNYLKSTLLNDKNQDILLLKSCLYTICSRYLKEISLIDCEDKNTDLAHKIISFTENNFKENITLASLAKNFGYEYHYFSRCFKNIFNMNFKTFVNHYRFNCAKELMLNTNMSLSEIAMESGFGSLRNFNRIYRQFANETPRNKR